MDSQAIAQQWASQYPEEEARLVVVCRKLNRVGTQKGFTTVSYNYLVAGGKAVRQQRLTRNGAAYGGLRVEELRWNGVDPRTGKVWLGEHFGVVKGSNNFDPLIHLVCPRKLVVVDNRRSPAQPHYQVYEAFRQVFALGYQEDSVAVELRPMGVLQIAS